MATAADVSELLATHPRPSEVDREALADASPSATTAPAAARSAWTPTSPGKTSLRCGGAFASAWTAPTSASRPDARSAARRNTSRRTRGRRSTAAGNPARPAPRSASATPSIMSIADSALKAAAVARQPAPLYSTGSEFFCNPRHRGCSRPAAGAVCRARSDGSAGAAWRRSPDQLAGLALRGVGGHVGLGDDAVSRLLSSMTHRRLTACSRIMPSALSNHASAAIQRTVPWANSLQSVVAGSRPWPSAFTTMSRSASMAFRRSSSP